MTNKLFLFVVFLLTSQVALSGDLPFASMRAHGDSTILASAEQLTPQPDFRNAWGMDVLISNDGFGLGTFYRREFSEDLSGFALFSISESKDEREFEQYDYYYGVSY
ncbi:MAG: hypothetical protein ABI623_07115, partial [bacterium]